MKRKFFKTFSFFFIAAFLSGIAAYFLLRLITPGGDVFGSLYKMFSCHLAYPVSYIAVVAFSFGVMGTLSVRLFGGVSGWRKHLLIVVILLSTVFVASMPGGVLWKIHDMRAGYFPNGIRLWQDLVWGAREGMQVGWLIPLSSFPYNLLVFVAGYAIAWAGFQLGHPRRKIKI